MIEIWEALIGWLVGAVPMKPVTVSHVASGGETRNRDLR